MIAPSTLFIHVEISGRWCFYRPNGPSCHSIKAQWKKKQIFQLHTHTHPFHGLFSGTTRVGQYQKGKTNLDFTEARDSERQWHQLGHMQVCTSLQTDDTPASHQFLQAGCPSCCPTNSVKALKAINIPAATGDEYSKCLLPDFWLKNKVYYWC